MKPDFDKIQSGMVSGLSKASKKQDKENQTQSEINTAFKGSEHVDMGTGVAGRSSVKMNNIDTDMRKFLKNPQFAHVANEYVERLIEKGYNYEDAIDAVWQELGV